MECKECGSKVFVIEGTITTLDEDKVILKVKCISCKHRYLVNTTLEFMSDSEALRASKQDDSIKKYIEQNFVRGD